MASKTYMQLVNEAIKEAKVSLDPLTSANFANPPRTLMYDNFKTWVNRSYKELLLSREEWLFRVERGTLTVWPRIHLAGITTALQVGDVLEAQESGVQVTVQAVHSYEQVEGSAVVESTISVEVGDSSMIQELILTEKFDRITPNPTVNVGYLKGLGRYDFAAEVPQLDEIDQYSLHAHDPIDSVSPASNISANAEKLEYVPWEKWYSEYEMTTYTSDTPSYFTRTPQGLYEFFPRVNEPFIISFNFTRKFSDMVMYNDTPIGVPEKYQDYIMWKAVEEYADFDNNTRLYARAIKNLDKYNYWLERDFLPDISFATSRYNY